MSTPQVILELDLPPVAAGAMGKSSTFILSEAYPHSPVNGENALNDKHVKALFRTAVMRGTDNVWNPIFSLFDFEGSQSYYAFETPFNRSYVGYGDLIPSLYKFQWGDGPLNGRGEPVNSFMPNLMSIPDGSPLTSVEPSKQLKISANDEARRGSAPFVGLGTELTPQKSIDNLLIFGWTKTPDFPSTQGTYVMGKSGATLDIA